MKKIIAIVGARPQFIKHIAVEKALHGHCSLKTIHTGQHYDNNMSSIFFEELNISKPNYSLQPDGSSPLVQLADIIQGVGDILSAEQPDIALVYGDTNSTIAGAIAAEKLNIPIAHVEAGLRSYNRNMPEEINRVLTDKISRYLFVPNEAASGNLLSEDIKGEVHIVGDVMKDCVNIFKDLPCNIDLPNHFIYLTIHRNYNTDNKERLQYILNNISSLNLMVIFPVHPRTRKLMSMFDIKESDYPNINFITPLSYLESIQYLKTCDALITDSGGMQKEAYYLKKRCITVRSETEWIETLKGNWNQLCDQDLDKLDSKLNATLSEYNEGLYGDGKAAQHIQSILA